MQSTRSNMWSFAFLCLCIALLSSVAMAQTTSGTITGTVTDQSGAVVPGAKITLTDEATKDAREVTGGDNGEFVFAALRPGTYTINVEKPGFQGFRKTGIVLSQTERLAIGNGAGASHQHRGRRYCSFPESGSAQ